MNYVYANAHEEKEALEKVKRYIGLVALPFSISGGAFVKALQTSIGLVSYYKMTFAKEFKRNKNHDKPVISEKQNF